MYGKLQNTKTSYPKLLSNLRRNQERIGQNSTSEIQKLVYLVPRRWLSVFKGKLIEHSGKHAPVLAFLEHVGGIRFQI